MSTLFALDFFTCYNEQIQYPIPTLVSLLTFGSLNHQSAFQSYSCN